MSDNTIASYNEPPLHESGFEVVDDTVLTEGHVPEPLARNHFLGERTQKFLAGTMLTATIFLGLGMGEAVAKDKTDGTEQVAKDDSTEQAAAPKVTPMSKSEIKKTVAGWAYEAQTKQNPDGTRTGYNYTAAENQYPGALNLTNAVLPVFESEIEKIRTNATPIEQNLEAIIIVQDGDRYFAVVNPTVFGLRDRTEERSFFGQDALDPNYKEYVALYVDPDGQPQSIGLFRNGIGWSSKPGTRVAGAMAITRKDANHTMLGIKKGIARPEEGNPYGYTLEMTATSSLEVTTRPAQKSVKKVLTDVAKNFPEYSPISANYLSSYSRIQK